nr:uncharacterized protein LOC109746334 [Aegilops tauschii subsp. strangulata]
MTDLEGLQASNLLTAFVVHRVLPLQGRPHMISQISGHRDPCSLSTREMLAMEVACMVNEIANLKLSKSDWQFGKRPYSRAHLPPASNVSQLLTTQQAADTPTRGQEFLPDRAVSDADDPDLGAAALEDDATAAPPAPSDAPKRRAGMQLQGGRPKKPKGSAAATTREEATAKAARFQKAPKQPPTVSAEPLSLERSTSASIIGGTEGSANAHRIDPLADLREATEKNAQEAREEKERVEKAKADAAKAAQEEADAVAKAQDNAAVKAQEEEATKAQADAAAKAQAGAAAGGQAPYLVIPLRSMPPVAGIPTPTGGANNDQPVMEREGGDAVIPRTEASQQASAAESQGSRPDAPSAPRVSGELVGGATPVVCTPTRWRVTKDYHNMRVAAYNSQVRELSKRTAELTDSQRANATLRQQMGEAQTVLHAKEEERLKMEQERDCLAKQLVDQAELQKLKDAEEAL